MMQDAVIYIVDDDLMVRKALSRLFLSAGWKPKTFTAPAELLEQETWECPGCIVLDVCMPGLNGLDLQKALVSKKIPTPIIFLTGQGDISMSVRAIKSGAVDFLTKPFSEKDLLTAVEDALHKDLARKACDAEVEDLQRRFQSLTPREREVLELVVKGLMNKQIAAELGMSEKTVKVHRGRVMHKMGVFSVADLVRASGRVQ